MDKEKEKKKKKERKLEQYLKSVFQWEQNLRKTCQPSFCLRFSFDLLGIIGSIERQQSVWMLPNERQSKDNKEIYIGQIAFSCFLSLFSFAVQKLKGMGVPKWTPEITCLAYTKHEGNKSKC